MYKLELTLRHLAYQATSIQWLARSVKHGASGSVEMRLAVTGMADAPGDMRGF